MFFEKEFLSFNLLDVLEMKQADVHMQNTGRNFNAISFRYRTDACLTTEKAAYQMQEHSVAFVPARLNYSRSARVDEMIVVHFETSDYRARGIETFVPKDPDTLGKLFAQILDCWSKKETGYRYKCAAILYEILAECYAQSFVPKPRNAKIQNAVDYILANYKSSDLSIKKAADRSFISEVYFRKLFKQEFGISPQRYIVDLRIQHAAGLISAGYYSLKEVAYLSGYNDYKYFSVEFKKSQRCLPLAIPV